MRRPAGPHSLLPGSRRRQLTQLAPHAPASVILVLQAPDPLHCQVVRVERRVRQKRVLPISAAAQLAATWVSNATRPLAKLRLRRLSCVHVMWGNPFQTILPHFPRWVGAGGAYLLVLQRTQASLAQVPCLMPADR